MVSCLAPKLNLLLKHLESNFVPRRGTRTTLNEKRARGPRQEKTPPGFPSGADCCQLAARGVRIYSAATSPKTGIVGEEPCLGLTSSSAPEPPAGMRESMPAITRQQRATWNFAGSSPSVSSD